MKEDVETAHEQIFIGTILKGPVKFFSRRRECLPTRDAAGPTIEPRLFEQRDHFPKTYPVGIKTRFPKEIALPRRRTESKVVQPATKVIS